MIQPPAKTGLQIMQEVRNNLIETDYDYALKTGMCLDGDAYVILCENLKILKELEYIQKILAVQLTIYVLRRVNGMAGESIDSLRNILCDLKFGYQLIFQKEFNDLNANIDY